ncbi:AAA family ATPase [Sphingomonas sp.]|jgi:SpoVK/Ycf46/Vps4 family AAA+-type ATPase|uniref:AAA family ATPase n=1 Tax=Sphingomonas sp. TaxID=28214 RepID=UPI002E1663DA|nr:AAA family ATPase [Sphingomonas sp.]HEV7289865.1 AAA family ATPase [Sphingomonas sp.]
MLHEHDVVRAMLVRAGRDVPATSPLAKAVLGWAKAHARWLFGAPVRKLGWRELKLLAAEAETPAVEYARPIEMAARLGAALGLSEADIRALLAIVAIERCGHARTLSRLLLDQEMDLGEVVAGIAGVDPLAVRRLAPVRLGLVSLHDRRGGGVDVECSWTLERVLERGPGTDDELLEAVIGPRQHARLVPGDFARVAGEVDFLIRLLACAIAARASGINVLIHGPPGTGKTELARTLAASAGASLFSVGESDEYGEEPTRSERVSALRLAQRMLAARGGSALLFDEMEDLIGDADPGDGDWMRGRRGSKLWVNRQIETNAVPVIWTTNAVGNIDPAILRRMSFVLRLDPPAGKGATAMIERIAQDEQLVLPAEFGALADAAPETASITRVAARAGQLAGGTDDAMLAARSLVGALRNGRIVRSADRAIDLDLYEGDCDIAALVAAIAAQDAPADVSLLLTGPPGTGKTELAAHLARTMERPLIVKRASDLLSKWVGETEANIAEAFAEAERREALLLFDEAESILFDRSTAKASWEVTQVNELLTWLDRHPLPVVAATNHKGRLDPAALRRFVFKLELGPLGCARAARAFERFFGFPAPADLIEVAGLTPGDFAVVRRQLRFGKADPARLIDLLRAEVAAKPGGQGRMGF